MGLETGNYINDMVLTNPIGMSDIKGQGDDHLRFIKKTVKQTFPGMAGRAWRKQTKSTAYAVAATDNMTVIETTGTFSLTFDPATLGNGFIVGLIVISGTITVNDGVDPFTVAAGSRLFLLSDGTVIYALGGTALLTEFELQDGSVEPRHLSAEVLGALVQELCIQMAAPGVPVTTSLNNYIDLRPCEILGAMIGCDTGGESSSGDVTMDMRTETGDDSIFTTLPTLGTGDKNSDIDGTPAVIDPTMAENATLQRYLLTVPADGTDVTGLKFYLTVRWGTLMTIPEGPTTVEPGIVELWAGDDDTPPDGYLFCNQAVSRTTYSALFAAVGTKWGPGNGTTTFDLPKTASRFIMGAGTGDSLSERTPADTFGVETVTLTAAQSGLVAHTHSAAGGIGSHTHNVPVFTNGGADAPGIILAASAEGSESTIATSSGTGGSVTVGTVAAADASSAHSIMNPGIVFKLIIKY